MWENKMVDYDIYGFDPLGLPAHQKVMYEFDVDVFTEVVDNIDVVLPLYRLFQFRFL